MIVTGKISRAALFGAVLITLAAAGCQGDPGPEATPASSAPAASPTPSVDASVAAADQAARAAYAGYIQTWALASQAADPDDPNLARYVADPLLSLTRHNIRKLKDIGAVQLGEQKATVLSSQADLAAKPPTVTLHSCLDYSTLKLVYKANQSPVPGSALSTTKFASIATVTQYTNGQWLVSETKSGSDPC